MVVRARLRYMQDMIPAPQPLTSWEAYWQFADSRRAASHQQPVPRPTGDNPDKAAHARIDDGRWIADCPWGCGAAFNLPKDATWMWCTECAGGGLGLTAALVWPDHLDRLTINIESLPSMLQYWPCAVCLPRLGTGRPCEACQGMQGLDS
ncbi:hypothetical protein [Nonomuraea sp. NPDC049400]|uniref:hypothetical protein n=1 Tax=Nonomuraea sp. NPDC049400 TaxID=3364352 RepID=UPI0037B51408